MPGKARILVPNCPHHIVQRGHNKKAVFLSDEDCQYYLINMRKWKEALGIKIYAWCLMTNHIHVIAEPGDNERTVSELMKRVNGRQAAYMNSLEGRSGALWGTVIAPAKFAYTTSMWKKVDIRPAQYSEMSIY